MKPCPFCGQVPELQVSLIRAYNGPVLYEQTSYFAQHWCKSLQTDLRAQPHENKAEAVKRWNRRKA